MLPNTAVSQKVLRVCISEVRAVLAEDVAGSTSIEQHTLLLSLPPHENAARIRSIQAHRAIPG